MITEKKTKKEGRSMLSSIHIENIAVIKKLDIEFSSGFCAFTGETGANIE